MNLDVLEKKRHQALSHLEGDHPMDHEYQKRKWQWQTRLLSDDFLRSLLKSNVHPNGAQSCATRLSMEAILLDARLANAPEAGQSADMMKKKEPMSHQ